MFRFLKEKLKRLLLIPMGKKRFGTGSLDDEAINTGRNPWQDDLYRLASERRLSRSTGTQACLRELTQAAEEAYAHESARKAQEAAGAKRPGDITGQDMKVWWGEALATWDPIDGKNVDSIEKQRHPRQPKWFQ
jgi:hypothetical protein